MKHQHDSALAAETPLASDGSADSQGTGSSHSCGFNDNVQLISINVYTSLKPVSLSLKVTYFGKLSVCMEGNAAVLQTGVCFTPEEHLLEAALPLLLPPADRSEQRKMVFGENRRSD